MSGRPTRPHNKPNRLSEEQSAAQAASAEAKPKRKVAARKGVAAKAGKAAAPKATTKKAKDPNAPKRPKTAFMYFSLSHRADVKNKNPNMSFGDIGKELGAQWAKVSASEKAKFEKMADEDKVRYQKETAKNSKK